MERFKLNDLVELKSITKEVYDMVYMDTYSKTCILGLCNMVNKFLDSMIFSLEKDEDKLYRTICELYPTAFGRHEMAKHFLDLLKERYDKHEKA